MPSPPALRESVLTTPAALERIAPVWKHLWSQTAPPPPMLEHEWVLEWWRLHGAEGELFIVLVFDADNTPVGLAPLYMRHMQFDAARSLRSVHFLGTGENTTDEVHGEYNGWLGAPEYAGAVSAAVARALLLQRSSWDRLWLQRLWPDRGIAKDLPDLLRPSLLEWSVSRMPTFRSPALRLDEYIARIPSKKMRSNCRRGLKAAASEGIDFVRSRSVAEAMTMFDALAALHQRQWAKRGAAGAFAGKVFTAFHRRMLARYAEREQPWIVGLRQRDRWIAVEYHIRAGDRLYDYIGGLDTTVPPALSPGLVLHLHAIDAAAAGGAQIYDFLGGDYPHKRRLALERDEVLTVDCLQANLRAKLWKRVRDLRRAAAGTPS